MFSTDRVTGFTCVWLLFAFIPLLSICGSFCQFGMFHEAMRQLDLVFKSCYPFCIFFGELKPFVSEVVTEGNFLIPVILLVSLIGRSMVYSFCSIVLGVYWFIVLKLMDSLNLCSSIPLVKFIPSYALVIATLSSSVRSIQVSLQCCLVVINCLNLCLSCMSYFSVSLEDNLLWASKVVQCTLVPTLTTGVLSLGPT